MPEKNNQPAISVLLPVYNGGAYLRLAVESVLRQSCTDFELLVLDDCSTDDSYGYLQGLNDTRIKLFRNEHNKGLFYNLNWLIGKTNSPLIKLWAQDDVMYPQCLEKFDSFFAAHPHVGFAYCAVHNIDENGRVKNPDAKDGTQQVISTEAHARIAFFTGSIAGNIANVCINKKALEKVGLFDESMKISADFDMWVRLARYYDTGFINEPQVQLRDHEDQLSRKESLYINHVREDMRVYRNLLGYVNAALKKEGKQMLRNHKFVFYYTLMVKSLLQGHFKQAFSFYKELNAMDNMLSLTIAFFKAKLIKGRKSAFE